MTTRNLDGLFKPKSVVVVGASDRPGSPGFVAARNLLDGGYRGEVALVNRRRPQIDGVRAYADVADLPHAFDLAVLAIPASAIPTVLKRLGRQGTRAAIVMTTDIPREGPGRARRLRQAMLDAARPFLMRVLGPDSLGVISTPAGLNASYAPLQPEPGRLAFVAQSGANMTAVADWAMARGIGFSRLVSLGETADVDAGDLLDYLATDSDTRAILLYVRDVTRARKFMSAARACARLKPVIVLKGGRFRRERPDAAPWGAAPDAVFDAAFRRAGMLRVHSLEAFFDSVQTLAYAPRLRGERLAVLSNGYNVGLLTADALLAADGHLADLDDAARAALNQALPGQWWGDNPIDLLTDAGPDRYAAALEILLAADGVDTVAVIHCPTALTSGLEIAGTVSRVAASHPDRVLTNWLGGDSAVPARRHFADAGIPTYDTPDQTVNAFMHLLEYRRNQAMLMETPASVPELFTPDLARARKVIDAALAAGREWLDETETREVLSAYGVASVKTARADGPAAVAERAREIDGPLVVKLLSPDVRHKSDVGGVTLNVETPQAAAAAAEGMVRRLRRLRPQARVGGFAVQPMIERGPGFELFAGVATDPTFGPVLCFGEGGIAVEALDDLGFALPPLNMHLALGLIRRTRVHRRLIGVRSQPAADLDALALALIQVGQVVADIAEVVTLEINPLIAGPDGALALDARMRVQPTRMPAADRLAIRPYPSELERDFDLPGGRRAWLRPIRPEDEPEIMATFRRLDSRERYFRFFASLAELTHPMAARLTQIDYDREMAWVLTDFEPAGRGEIYAVARIIAIPDNDRAEYAITVRGDYAGQGLGTRLMQIILDYARCRGITEVFGEVLAENRAMLRMCEKLGFERRREPGELGVVHVVKRLDTGDG